MVIGQVKTQNILCQTFSVHIVTGSCAGGSRYRIKRGDSLIRIAKNFDTEVGLLQEVNHIKGSRIRAGDTLMIPEGTAWASSLAMAPSSSDRTQRGYRVRPGDSLYLIAGKFKVSIDQIIAWNSLNPKAYLQPGQKLTLYVEDS